MEALPLYIGVVLALTTLVTVVVFYKATAHSRRSVLLLAGWLAIQSIVSSAGFYTVTSSVPPRFLLLIFPPVLLIVLLFVVPKGKAYLDTLDIKTLTLLHTIRIPVELVLWWLSLHKVVPELMTFEGRNLDILSGLTAPLVYYFGFIRKSIHRRVILIWNLICLGLLINIVANAILSVPFPFQQFAFDQPNIAVLYFPFIWLPCCIVPLVLLSHLASIRVLVRKQ